MTFATYAPRVMPHTGRYGAKRSTDRLLWLVIHDSEGGEGSTVLANTSAENLAAFMQTPATATNVASYNYVTDTDRIIPCTPDDVIAYAQGGANTQGLSICYPGKAAQTAEQWTDVVSSAQHEQVARWLADKSLEYGIPLVKLSGPDLVAGRKGVCGHIDVTNAFHKTTHTDPGPNYPWASVLARAQSLVASLDFDTNDPPKEDDDMFTPATIVLVNGRVDWFVVGRADKHAYHYWREAGGAVQGPQDIGGEFMSALSVSGSLDLLVVSGQGLDGNLYSAYWPPSDADKNPETGWSTWAQMAEWP